MGNFVHEKSQYYLKDILLKIHLKQSFDVVFNHENNG